MGCVKVLDNLPSNIGPFVNTNNSDNLKPLYALILTPTRELAIQVKNHLVAAAKHTGIQYSISYFKIWKLFNTSFFRYKNSRSLRRNGSSQTGKNFK